MLKSRKQIAYICIAISMVFIGTYLGFSHYFKIKNAEKIKASSVMSESKFKKTVKNDCELTFKTIYLKSGDIIEKQKNVLKYDKNLIGYDKEKLEYYFSKKGFDIENMNNDKISLVKKIDKYSPDKYVLGIKKTEKGDYLAIFKTDKNGDMKIENKSDITRVNADMLGKEQIRMFTEGSKEFQFDTKEKAEEAISEYQS